MGARRTFCAVFWSASPPVSEHQPCAHRRRPSGPWLHFPVQLCCFVCLFFPFSSKSSGRDEMESFSAAGCCMYAPSRSALVQWSMTFSLPPFPSPPPPLSPPLPHILWVPACLQAAYNFPQEGRFIHFQSNTFPFQLHLCILPPLGSRSTSWCFISSSCLLPPAPQPSENIAVRVSQPYIFHQQTHFQGLGDL